jgi:N-methylhydantoinase A
MRFVGQNFELSVPIERPINQRSGAAAPRLPGVLELHDLFFRVHEQHYGFHNSADPVEVISVRVTALAALLRGADADAGGMAHQAAPPAVSPHRPVHFDGNGSGETPVYDRAALAPGHVLAGPAIIEQFDATTVLHPTDRLRIDEGLNMVIEVTP